MSDRDDAVPSTTEGGGTDPLARLLRESALGDQRAFSSLYDATCGALYDLVLRVVRDGAMAEGIVRETYREVWAQSGRYEGPAPSPLSWIIGLGYARALAAAER